MRIEDICGFEQQFAAEGGRGVTPGGKCCSGGFDGALGIVSLPGGNRGGRLPVEWVRLLVGTFRGCVRPFSVDEELMLRSSLLVGVLIGLPVHEASAR